MNVKDINDCEPLFDEQEYSVEVMENTANNTFINLKLHAKDGDATSVFNNVIYEISSNDPFRIDRDTGEIFVYLDQGQSLDYESEQNQFIVFVYAKDGRGKQSNAEVTIKLLDQNDNPPQIISNLEQNLLNNQTGIVLKLEASDKDSGDNGKVKFLMEPSNEYIELKQNGDLTIVKSLEQVFQTFKFNLTLTDSGNPPMSTTEELSLNILDVNDKAPQFTKPSGPIYILEVISN